MTSRALLSTASALQDTHQPGALPLDFESVYHLYAAFVWRSLARLGVPSEQLADATQDVFLVVHRRLAAFEGRSSLKTWLFGIALRVARDVSRRARRRPTEPLPPGLPAASTDSPYESALRSEAVGLLYRLLDQLTPEQRAVFVLVELEQTSIPEAAEAVGANVHTVTSRLRAARKQFEAAMRRHQMRHERRRP